jgi:hypothetical protein
MVTFLQSRKPTTFWYIIDHWPYIYTVYYEECADIDSDVTCMYIQLSPSFFKRVILIVFWICFCIVEEKANDVLHIMSLLLANFSEAEFGGAF